MLRRSRRERPSPYAARKSQLEGFFEDDLDQRFQLEDRHDKGGQASVYRIKYTIPKSHGSMSRLLVLKLATADRGSDVKGIRTEKDMLSMLQGCRHIARMRNLPDDPLAPSSSQGWAWIFLDRIQNGTLTDFMARFRNLGRTSLPNRLLWRLFLCMVRACIAMAWPRNDPHQNETTAGKGAQPMGITHNDVHGHNFMFGPLLEDPEHDVSPLLQLIDFGQSELWRGKRDGSGATAEQWNIEDIGLMMATVINLMTDRRYTGQEIEVDLSKLGRPSDVRSPASGILPDVEMGEPDPHPLVDLDLRLLVAACMAAEPRLRPTLAELENWVSAAVAGNSPASYSWLPSGAQDETDNVIRDIVRACIIEADT